ncbi:MAG: hypothetical protein ACI9VN_003514 [Patescibacteria group bacterium]|jgi:hypothetical protein
MFFYASLNFSKIARYYSKNPPPIKKNLLRSSGNLFISSSLTGKTTSKAMVFPVFLCYCFFRDEGEINVRFEFEIFELAD